MTSTVRAKMAQQEKEKKVAQRLSENPVIAEIVEVREEQAEPKARVKKPKAKSKLTAKKKTTAKKDK